MKPSIVRWRIIRPPPSEQDCNCLNATIVMKVMIMLILVMLMNNNSYVRVGKNLLWEFPVGEAVVDLDCDPIFSLVCKLVKVSSLFDFIIIIWPPCCFCVLPTTVGRLSHFGCCTSPPASINIIINIVNIVNILVCPTCWLKTFPKDREQRTEEEEEEFAILEVRWHITLIDNSSLKMTEPRWGEKRKNTWQAFFSKSA